MEKIIINVSYGTFEIVDAKNSKGRGVYVKTLDGIGAYSIPDAFWWDKDRIVNTLEKKKDDVIKTINKKRGL